MLGDNEEDFSKLFYFVNRHFLYLLDNNPEVSIREKDILYWKNKTLYLYFRIYGFNFI